MNIKVYKHLMLTRYEKIILKSQSKEIQCISGEPIFYLHSPKPFKFRSVVLPYKVQVLPIILFILQRERFVQNIHINGK